MSSLSERLELIIKTRGITRTEFAKRLNVTQPYVSKIINTGATPSDRILYAICREFKVNEAWLRDGVGPMEKQSDEFSLDEFARQHDATELDFQFIRNYLELDPSIRQLLHKHFKAT